MRTTRFEKAIFLGWYCSLGDCTYCYMSTQKQRITDPKKAVRSMASILAEVIICKKQGWGIEFLSAGYGNFTTETFLPILKSVYDAYGEKLWLNIGVLSEAQLRVYLPYIRGSCGAVETMNPEVHKKIAPNKPIEPIVRMFKACDRLGLKKCMTIILGVGESIEDFPKLESFIAEHKIDKITFFRLKALPGTEFEGAEPIKSGYYELWVKKIRESFPEIEITVGSWITHLDEIHLLLNAGADQLTKFPAIKWFNSDYARKIEAESKKAGRGFLGSLTELREVSHDDLNCIRSYSEKYTTKELRDNVMKKIVQYHGTMKNKKEKSIEIAMI